MTTIRVTMNSTSSEPTKAEPTKVASQSAAAPAVKNPYLMSDGLLDFKKVSALSKRLKFTKENANFTYFYNLGSAGGVATSLARLVEAKPALRGDNEVDAANKTAKRALGIFKNNKWNKQIAKNIIIAAFKKSELAEESYVQFKLAEAAIRAHNKKVDSMSAQSAKIEKVKQSEQSNVLKTGLDFVKNALIQAGIRQTALKTEKHGDENVIIARLPGNVSVQIGAVDKQWATARGKIRVRKAA